MAPHIKRLCDFEFLMLMLKMGKILQRLASLKHLLWCQSYAGWEWEVSGEGKGITQYFNFIILTGRGRRQGWKGYGGGGGLLRGGLGV